jgi:hypothetical protein
MKNYSKMTLIVLSFLFLVAFADNASASFSKDNFVYIEDHSGAERGFAVNFPRNNDCGYRDWTADGRKCARTAYYDYEYVEYYGYKPYGRIDQQAVIKEAFKTYQQNSKLQYKYDYDTKKLDYEYRPYRYYGYHYYPRHHYRYYSYGW